MGYYTNAAICKNGHVDTSDTSSGISGKFCKTCGAEIINKCPQCGVEIQGDYRVTGIAMIGFSYTPPSYCHNCSKPYPWTEARIEAAKMLIEDMEELSEEEKRKMSESIDKIITDTPYTEVSANRIKRGLLKIGKEGASMLRDILVNIATEAAKKHLGL